MVILSPVSLHLALIVWVVSSGSSALRLLVIAFLLVDKTPDFGRGFLIHAVMNSFGGCRSGEHAVFPRYVMDCAFNIDLASGMSWNIF